MITERLCRLRFRSLDHAGHMGVEGFIGMRGVHAVKLNFSVIEFCPSELPGVVRELRTCREDSTLRDDTLSGMAPTLERPPCDCNWFARAASEPGVPVASMSRSTSTTSFGMVRMARGCS